MCPRPLPLLLLTACLGLLSGCGGYANTSEAFRKSLGRGAPDQALGRVNEALGVDRPDQLPSEKEADTPLLLLERGTILQAMGRYEDSARDFQAADSMIDVLDLSSDGIGSLGKYLFSDDATLYKAPPHEKLLLNTFNMVNYLALGDAGGAKVEARRLVISSKYLENIGESDARRMLALASYLAGFAFEAAGEADQAMRHYADAYAAGGLPTLDEAIRHLHATRGATDPRVAELLAGGEAEGAPGTADLVVVVQTGMAPFREPVRVPIANAILLTHRDGHARLSAADQRRAQVMATKGLLKWVNYPRLRRVGRRRATGAVQVDGRTLPRWSRALDVEGRVLEEFERAVPSLVAASITRLLARAVAGELSQAATKKGSGNGLAGLLVGLAVEGAMVAADTPDTRGWVTLPASVYVARMRVPAGKRRVTVAFGAETQEVMVDLPAGGWKLLNFSAAR